MIDLQNLSKSKEGRKMIVDWSCHHMSPNFDRNSDIDNWKYYNNDFPKNKFDYLRQYGDYVLPVEVRHYPIQRPYINYLTSRQVRRPFLIKAKVTDKKSMLEKRLFFIKEVMHQVETQMVTATIMEQFKLQQIQNQLQQIAQLAQQEPQSEEQAQQIQQAKQVLPQLQLQFTLLQEQSKNTTEKYKEVIDQVKANRKKDVVDFIEEKCSKQLKRAMTNLEVREKGLKNFICETVTGKQYYYVNYDNGRPVFRTINSDSVFYTHEENKDWVQDCEMGGFTEKMSLSQVINEFKLNSNEIRRIRDEYGYNQNDNYFVGTPNTNAVYIANGVNPSSEGEGYEVKRVWWIYEKPIRYIKSPNKHSGKYFHRFLDDKDQVINEEDYNYDHKERKWVSKEDKSLAYEDRKVHRYNESKGQAYETRYIQVRYKGVLIAGKIVREEEDPVQLWKSDNKQFNQLPIIGPTFNSSTDVPYSYIEATKGLQEFYNLLGFHEELMMATAGTKTLLFDMVQKPNNLSEKEWMYNVKIGFAKLESWKKEIGRVPFNQFQEIDLSLSSSIQYINNIKVAVEDQMGRIFGISRQAMGVTVNSDQVGTFELSQQSALLITEVLFHRHDLIMLKALTMLVNILTKYDNQNEDYIEDEEDGSIDIIPANFFTGRDFDLKSENNSKEENDLTQLKQLALSYAAKGQYKFGEMIRLYKIDNLNEFQREIDKLDKQTEELRAQIEQQQQGQAEELRQKAIELENQYKMAMEKEKNRLKELELQIKSQEAKDKLALDREKINRESQQKNVENQLKGIELANEQAMETAVLEENKSARTMDQKINLMEIQLNAIANKLNISLQKNKQDQDFAIGVKKTQVEETKARKMTKEHVSDK